MISILNKTESTLIPHLKSTADIFHLRSLRFPASCFMSDYTIYIWVSDSSCCFCYSKDTEVWFMITGFFLMRWSRWRSFNRRITLFRVARFAILSWISACLLEMTSANALIYNYIKHMKNHNRMDFPFFIRWDPDKEY